MRKLLAEVADRKRRIAEFDARYGDVDMIQGIVSEMLADVANRLKAWPKKCAEAVIGHNNSIPEARVAIDQSVTELLTELASYPMRRRQNQPN